MSRRYCSQQQPVRPLSLGYRNRWSCWTWRDLMYTPSSLDVIRSLYNGYGAIAERVDVDQARRLHMVTDLDAALGDWAADRISIILTGNPGDGKTHLFTVLERE